MNFFTLNPNKQNFLFFHVFVGGGGGGGGGLKKMNFSL